MAGIPGNGDNLIKIATLALVVLGGGGNLIATKSVKDSNEAEVELAIKEIHELHAAIDSALAKQQEVINFIREQKKNP